MPQLIKHILTIVIVVLITQALMPSMRKAGVRFDPVDISDNATMKAKTEGTILLSQHDVHKQQKEIAGNYHQKNHKKSKIKRISFQLAPASAAKENFSIAGVDGTHSIRHSECYRHLYYRDMNPPPRCSQRV